MGECDLIYFSVAASLANNVRTVSVDWIASSRHGDRNIHSTPSSNTTKITQCFKPDGLPTPNRDSGQCLCTSRTVLTFSASSFHIPVPCSYFGIMRLE